MKNYSQPNHHLPNTDIVTEVANAVGSRGLVYPVIGSISGRVHSLKSIDDLMKNADAIETYFAVHGPIKF